MTAKIYILSLIAGYFLLWAYMSEWSPHTMVFYEGNADWRPPAARLGVAFILFVAAFVIAISPEGKKE